MSQAATKKAIKKPSKAGHSAFDAMIDDIRQLNEFLEAGHTLQDAAETGLVRIRRPAKPLPVGAISCRKARAALGLSQPEFAEFLGVSPQTIKAWEQARKEPTPPVLLMLKHIGLHPKTWKKSL